MPLTFDWQDMKDFEQHIVPREHGEGMQPNPQLETFILLMMPMGVSHEVTEKNVGEFWARLDLMQRMQGAFMHRAGPAGMEDVYFTPEDVIAYIGLKTNCSTRTRTDFLKSVVKDHMDEQARVCTGSEFFGRPENDAAINA